MLKRTHVLLGDDCLGELRPPTENECKLLASWADLEDDNRASVIGYGRQNENLIYGLNETLKIETK